MRLEFWNWEGRPAVVVGVPGEKVRGFFISRSEREWKPASAFEIGDSGRPLPDWDTLVRVFPDKLAGRSLDEIFDQLGSASAKAAE